MMVLKRFFRQENIYSVIWCLYSLQGFLYPEGGIISRGLLAIFFLMSFFYFAQVLRMPNLPSVIKALACLVVLFGVYGLIRIFVSTFGWRIVNQSTTFFKEYELSLLPIFAFYYFAKKGRLSVRWFYKVTFLFFAVALLIYMYQGAQARIVREREDVTNNAGYLVASLLPLVVFLRKKPVLQYCALFLIYVVVIQGMKRGAIISVVLGSSYFVWDSFVKARGVKKFLFVFLGVVAVTCAVAYFQYQLESSDYMQYRLERTMDGDASERENIYPEFLHFFFNNAGPLEFLFGFGADGGLKYLGNFAHQDWIQVLIDEGFVGILLMLYFWIAAIATALKSVRLKCTNMTLILFLFIIINFSRTMYSMSINGFTIFSSSAFAFALAGLDNPFIRNDLMNV